MKKRLTTEDLTTTEGPMNAVALDDAKCYLGFGEETPLTPIEEKQVRNKKHKIVTATKKMGRRVSKEVTRRAKRLD
jgi:hypothetical protein